MTFFQAIFLAVVQGVTEFLPISSSGHLVLFQKIFHLTEPPVFFDVLLHLGSLGAILFFFRKRLIVLVKEWKNKKRQWVFLIVGSMPAAFFGLFLNSKIEIIFNSLKLLGIMWVCFGLLLLATKTLKVKKEADDLGKITWKDALVVGLFQAIALFPGISRSGSTIIGGLLSKLSPETAFYLSFLLSIPAILGATLLKLRDGSVGGVGLVTGTVSILIAGLVGYFSLKFLGKILKSDKFYLFGFYCLVLGIFVLLKFNNL